MKAFRFNLEQILLYKKQKEEMHKRELAEAQRSVKESQFKILQLILAEKESKEQIRKMHREGKHIEMNLFLAHQRYQRALTRKIADQQEKLGKLLIYEKEKRENLLKATKETKIIEKLKERQLNSYNYELSKDEQKTVDETGLNIFFKNISESTPPEPETT